MGLDKAAAWGREVAGYANVTKENGTRWTSSERAPCQSSGSRCRGGGLGGGAFLLLPCRGPSHPRLPAQKQGDRLQRRVAAGGACTPFSASRLLRLKCLSSFLEGRRVLGLLGSQWRALVGRRRGRHTCLTCSLLFQICVLLPPTAMVKCAFSRLF